MSTKHEAEEVWIVEWKDIVSGYWIPEAVYDDKENAEDSMEHDMQSVEGLEDRIRVRRYIPQEVYTPKDE